MHDRVARSTTLVLVALACLWGTACASRYTYTPENPRNLKAPPEWTAHPTRLTEQGDFEVVGEARASEPGVAFKLAESDARARAALYFQSLADAGAGSRAKAVDETVVAQDAVTHGSTEASLVQVGGLMPVERWYDTRAEKAYALLRMPAREYERLRAVYTRKTVEGAGRESEPEGLTPSATTTLPAEPARAQGPSASPESAREPTTTPGVVEAYGYRFTAKGCRQSGPQLTCTVEVENLEPRVRKLNVSVWACGTAIYDGRGNKYCPDVAVADGRYNGAFVVERFLPRVPVDLHFRVEDAAVQANALTLAISIARWGEKYGRDLVTLRAVLHLSGTHQGQVMEDSWNTHLDLDLSPSPTVPLG